MRLGVSTCKGVGNPSEHCSVGCKEMRGWGQELTLFVVAHFRFAYVPIFSWPGCLELLDRETMESPEVE